MSLFDVPRKKMVSITMSAAALSGSLPVEITLHYQPGEFFLDPAKFGWLGQAPESIAEHVFSCAIRCR
jgi:hypothetical protein